MEQATPTFISARSAKGKYDHVIVYLVDGSAVEYSGDIVDVVDIMPDALIKILMKDGTVNIHRAWTNFDYKLNHLN